MNADPPLICLEVRAAVFVHFRELTQFWEVSGQGGQLPY